jgi:hypothetical protein
VTILLAGASAASARDPRDEKERLRPADMRLAARATLTRADLAGGWKRQPDTPDDNESRCPGQPDFSAFTITGKAESQFAHPRGGYIASIVEVYATKAQAIGDFRLGARPAFARCLAHAFEGDFANGAGGRTRTISSRMVPAPRVGEQSAVYRLVGTLTVRRTTVRVYFDVHAFRRGRSIAVAMFMQLGSRVADQTMLARRVASRMR